MKVPKVVTFTANMSNSAELQEALEPLYKEGWEFAGFLPGNLIFQKEAPNEKIPPPKAEQPKKKKFFGRNMH